MPTTDPSNVLAGSFLSADDRIYDQRLMSHTVRLLANRMPDVVETFYARLFASEPALRDMFPADMSGQHIKLIDTISRLVLEYTNPNLETVLEKMGRRHATYGVNIMHYAAAGEVLLGVLDTFLSDDPYWPEAHAAWLRSYQWTAGTMMKAGAMIGPAHITP